MIDQRRIPQDERLPARIKAFFMANPGEYLTYEDIVQKFDCDAQQARLAVDGLKKREGLLITQTVVCLRPAD